MTEIAAFQQRLKQSTENMESNLISANILELKSLSKDISNYMIFKKIQENDQLSEMQITIFNNLACLYEKKGKYRTSLYHLQIAEELQNKYFNHKYNGDIPGIYLEKLSTTYSNLSAIQSKLGNYKDAILNAEFAIQILSKHQNSKEHKSLVYLYYNYSFLLDVLEHYRESSQYAAEGLKIAHQYEDKKMIANYEHLLKVLKEKLAKKQSRKLKEIKKHLKGQLGIVKSRREIQQNFMNATDTIDIQEPQKSGQERQLKQRQFSALKEYLTVEKKYFSKPSLPQSRERHLSTFTTLTNNRKKQNYSYYSKKGTQKQTIDDKGTSKVEEVNKDLVRNELQSENTNRNTLRSAYLFDKTYFSGKILPNTFNNTLKQGREFRIKSKKRKLEEQIQNLNKKNEALEKIIQKIYDAEKNSH